MGSSLDQVPAQPGPVQQDLTQPNQPKTLLWVLLAVTLTAIIVGGAVYVWQQKKQKQSNLSQQEFSGQADALPTASDATLSTNPTTMPVGISVPTLSPEAPPVPSASIQVERFNSKYFNLSFDVPSGFEVFDSQNLISISKGKNDDFKDSTFLSIDRFDKQFTKEQSIAETFRLFKNRKESKVSIDGGQFLQVEGNIDGNKIIRVFFEKSLLQVEMPVRGGQDFDVFLVADRIISSMTFFSAVKEGYSPYSSSKYGFTVFLPKSWTTKEKVDNFNGLLFEGPIDVPNAVEGARPVVTFSIEEIKDFSCPATQVTISGMTWNRVEECFPESIYYYVDYSVERNGKRYVFDTTRAETELRKMLSGFRWL